MTMRVFFLSVFGAILFCGNAATKEEIDDFSRCDSVRLLDEVSVTSIKERTTTEAIPGSVTSIGLKRIEDYDILNVKQASSLVPNFYIPDYGSRMTSSIYVRGIGARIDQPAVGLNVDNVPYLNKDNYDFDIADIERIEIFRGPQSTLYGRNTMMGLVNVYTLSPFRYQGVRSMVRYGSGESLAATAGFYTLLSDRIGIALSGSYASTGGFHTNIYNGKKSDNEKTGSLRWKTVWRPDDRVIVENTASLSLNRQHGYPYASLSTGEINYNDTCFYRRTGVADGLTLNLRLPGWTLSSITSFQYIDDNMTLDQDFLPVNLFNLTQRRHEWALTQDLIARGNSGDYKWLAGAFGFYKRTNMSAPVTFKDDGIRSLIEDHVNRPGTKYPISFDKRSFVLGSDFVSPDCGFAFYHRSSYRVGNFNFIGDLRLDHEKVKLDYFCETHTGYTMMNLNTTPPSVFQKVPLDIVETGDLNRSFTELIPKLSVEYSVTPSSTLYLTVAKGYKAGGFNVQMFSNVLQQSLMEKFGIAAIYNVEDIIKYDPEKSWNYEAGWKFGFPSVALDGSVAAFYIDCHDQQLTMFPPGSLTGRMMTNAGKTRSLGGEMSLAWHGCRNLSLAIAYGFTDAKFVEFNDGRNDFAGKRVPYAPQNTFYASADYTLCFSSGIVRSLELHGGLRGVGSICWNEENTVRQPFYTLFDASVKANFSNRLSLEVSGENLFDYDYDVFYFMSVGNEFVQRGKPARVNATLRFVL